MMSASRPIAIRLNGEARRLSGGLTVAELLKELGKDPRTVAVELNGTILPRGGYGRADLVEGDCVEVVQFVQGG